MTDAAQNTASRHGITPSVVSHFPRRVLVIEQADIPAGRNTDKQGIAEQMRARMK